MLWLKEKYNKRVEVAFTHHIYCDNTTESRKYLEEKNISYAPQRKSTWQEEKNVLKIKVPNLELFERFVTKLERGFRYRIALYNADITPEQAYLYENNLRPCTIIKEEQGKIVRTTQEATLKLKTLKIEYGKTLKINDEEIEKESFLHTLTQTIHKIDPDLIVMQRGFRKLPQIVQKMQEQKIACLFHRWDQTPITYRGGRSFWQYNSVTYQDYAIRLHGRFLIDTSSFSGTSSLEAIMELVRLSGNLFQQIAARSPGTVFQTNLVREMYSDGLLIPYKQKPLDEPITLRELIKADRARHTLDPKLGFHKDVAEIDFTSMFSWLIYNHNISAETLLSKKEPLTKVPGLKLTISMAKQGYTPRAIKPILDARMECKKYPTIVNKAKAEALKGVLVSSYGYLRFREFKLGLAAAHMAICAYAREALIKAMHIAEGRGFNIIHGIVDSLYVQKKGITTQEVKELCQELEQQIGVPMAFEGIFKWVVFLSSVDEDEKAVPARYYGVFSDGKIKARGIEVRKKSCPRFVREFQKEVLLQMAIHNSEEDIKWGALKLGKLLRTCKQEICKQDAINLARKLTINKTQYKNNIVQQKAIRALRMQGEEILPGQSIMFVHAKGIELVEDYSGKPDEEYYGELLERALYTVLQPFGFSRKEIEEMGKIDRQTRLEHWTYGRSALKQ